MTYPSREDRLEDVLDAFMADVPGPDAVHVTAWVQRFPEFRQEIVAFAASWAMRETFPASTDEVTDEEIRARGLLVLDRLRGTAALLEADEEITDLVPIGRTLRDLAQQAGISASLWRALDRRLVNDVPAEVVAVIAATLGSTIAAVTRFLAGPPRVADGALYSADGQPAVGQKVGFAEYVRLDRQLPEVRRRYLLSLVASLDAGTGRSGEAER